MGQVEVLMMPWSSCAGGVHGPRRPPCRPARQVGPGHTHQPYGVMVTALIEEPGEGGTVPSTSPGVGDRQTA